MMRFDTISDLTNPQLLCRITGPVTRINKTLLSAVGFSGSVLEKVEVNLQSGIIRKFVLKYTRLKVDWLSQRARDQVGREAALLNESGLSGIWKSIHCPYTAFAIENGEIGLLMDDFSAFLFPDIREPIDIKSEDLILDAIASLHASFWESSAIRKTQWLMQPRNYLEVLGPYEHESDNVAAPPDKLRNSMLEGWNIALRLLPVDIKNILKKPAYEIFEHWNDLPVTLLHGDAKIANMAILPNQKLVMFDWTYVGWGPCGIELGWYLAVNSTRLARTKENLIKKYRSCLESHLKFRVREKTWLKMTDFAVITGTMMMLWNKALGYQAGTKRGKDEWDWWVGRLKTIISNMGLTN
jgi:Phosphotransferase enzyme family